MKIFIGSDHAGFKLKEGVKRFLDTLNIEYVDLGNHVLDKKDDYPDFSYKVASQVTLNPGSLGILFCGSAHGACITANKVKGIRAASVNTPAEVKLAREHDDVNIVCLAGGDQVQKIVKAPKVSLAKAKEIIRIFINAKFSKADRHHRRVGKIKDIEKRNFA